LLEILGPDHLPPWKSRGSQRVRPGGGIIADSIHEKNVEVKR
jgi:hypothetical protein